MTIPVEKQEFLKQMATTHGIPLADLQKFYENHLNNEAYKTQFTTPAELMEYIDMLLGGHIQDYVNSTMEEFEVIVIASSTPRESKKGSVYSNHTCTAMRTPQQMADNAKANKGNGENRTKWLTIRNGDDSGILNRITPLSTGRIKVSVGKEDDGVIEAYSRPNSEFIAQPISFVNEADKKAYVRKTIRNVTLATAGSNMSAKDDKGYAISHSLRMIYGTIASRRINKKVNETTKVETESGMINIMDNSVQGNSEFFKNKQVNDPENPGKTKTQYGGFSGFCEADDIRELDRGTLALFIGHITNDHSMNVQTIIPLVPVCLKKPTDKLQKPVTKAPEAPVTNAAYL